MPGKEKERNQQQTRSTISRQHAKQQGMCHTSNSSGLPYFSLCCEAQTGQTQRESRSKHNAAISAGKLRGNISQEREVTHHVHWGTPYRIKKTPNPPQLDTQRMEIQDSLTWRRTSALQQVIYTERLRLPRAEEQKGLQVVPNNKVTLF